MTEHRWIARERSFAELPRQALFLFQLGAKKPLHVIAACIALALLLAGSVVLAQRTYEPRVVLRVVEADRDPSSMPELKRKLAEYVREGVFTTAPLLDIIHRYGLYPKLRDPRSAVEAFRRDTEVDVYQNYFVEQRADGESPRSARVAVSYRARERAVAVAVTRDLGALIVARVTASREEQASRAAAIADDAAAQLQRTVTDRYSEIASAHQHLERTGDPKIQVKLVSLLGSLPGLEQRLDAAEKRAAALELGAAYENHGIGLHFDVAEDAALPLFDRHYSFRFVGAALVFVLGLPFVVLGVGAGTLARGHA